MPEFRFQRLVERRTFGGGYIPYVEFFWFFTNCLFSIICKFTIKKAQKNARISHLEANRAKVECK